MTLSFKSLIVGFLLSTTITSAQDSLSVLFIGNSYTYVNNLPNVFLNLTQSLGDNASIDSKTNGGYIFQYHLDDPLTHTKIQSQAWDYVVLQGQSQEPSFQTDEVNMVTVPPAVKLADTVYANNFCSQVMYFMTWGRQNGDPQWDSINTFDKMNLRLRNAYLRISDSAEASVAPIGVAWKYVRDNYPTINLYSGDGSHPSLEGTYLAACGFYASLFRKSPVGATYTAGLSATVAAQLQVAAEITIIDSLETWHLRSTEELSIADFSYTNTTNEVEFNNQSWRALSYFWNFGDGNTSTDENPSHSYSNIGNFNVQLIAESPCGNDTTYQTITINNLNINSFQNEVKLSYLGENKYRVSGITSTHFYELMDASGRKFELNVQNESTENSFVIDLSKLSSGIYFLKLDCSLVRLIRF